MSPQDARRLQMKLAAHIIRENKLGTVKTVSGIDVGMKGDMVCAPVLKKIIHSANKLSKK